GYHIRSSHQFILEVHYIINIDELWKLRQWKREICENRIPILIIYKNGIPIETLDLQSLTGKSCDEIFPEKPNFYSYGQGYYQQIFGDYYKSSQATLNDGEYATFKAVIDPRNVIREGRFREDGTLIESLENNNEKEVRLGWRDISVSIDKCPQDMAWQGQEISVRAIITNYFAGSLTREKNSILIFAKLSKDRNLSDDDPYLAATVDEFAFAESKTINLKGKVPNLEPGNYYLIVKAELSGKSRGFPEANMENNIVYCSLNIQPTAQQTMKEQAKNGEMPPPSIPKEAKEISMASLPDLTITKVEVKQDCKVEITVKNLGAPLQDSQYQANPNILRIREAAGMHYGRALANFNLNDVDPQKMLKNINGETKFIWIIPKNMLPIDKDLSFTVDPERKIIERDEQNNHFSKRIICPLGTQQQKKTK
ncbi:MAG: hypothetical protein ABDH16_04845, partial [Thermodesulfovibrionaceae bacterium]